MEGARIMAKDVFTVYSEDGRHRATCIVDLECDGTGRYGYHIIPTTGGVFGWAKSLKDAMKRAEESAHETFQYKNLEHSIKRILKEFDTLKHLAR